MTILEEMKSATQECESRTTALFNTINDFLSDINQSNVESEILPQGRESINGIHTRILALISLLKNFDLETLDTKILPQRKLAKLKNQTNAVIKTQNHIITKILEINTQGGIGSIDKNTLVINNKKNDQSYAFGQDMANLDDAVDSALDFYYSISSALLPNLTPSRTSEIFRELRPTIDQIKETRAIALNIQKESTENIEKFRNTLTEASDILKNAKELYETIGDYHNRSHEFISRINKDVKRSEDVLVEILKSKEASDILKSKIAEHHSKLDEFDAEMQGRVEAAQSGKEHLSTLIKNFEFFREDCKKYCENKKTEIEEIMDRAKSMLGLATSVGLGHIFKTQAENRGRSITFHYGMMIFALFIIALVGCWTIQGVIDKDHWYILLAKFAIILPFAVLASISVKTIRILEKAKEKYEHKTSISFAVEGYRRLFKDDEEQTKLIKDTVLEVLKDPSEGLEYPQKDDESILGFLDRLATTLHKIRKE